MSSNSFKRIILPAIAFLTIQCSSFAASVDSLLTYSPSMKKHIKAAVIKPSGYKTGAKIPVVYLLHGYSDNYSGWLTKAKGFEKAADLHNMLIVCPDGGFSSWYWDSPIDPSYQYETYITKELIPFIDSAFSTISNRKGRAITGLSMGGHGALYLAFRHQDLFGAAGSMSGGVDIRPFPNNWEMTKRIGKYSEHPEYWEQHTVMNQLHLLTPNALDIMIDCGTGDFFYDVNMKLHEALLYRNIPHDFLTRPGVHNWAYWLNAVQYQLLFMHNYFQKAAATP